jgi:hypothetical protein
VRVQRQRAAAHVVHVNLRAKTSRDLQRVTMSRAMHATRRVTSSCLSRSAISCGPRSLFRAQMRTMLPGLMGGARGAVRCEG